MNPADAAPPAPPLPLVDAHAHLQFRAFDTARDSLLARARDAGLLHLHLCAVDEADWDRTAALAGAFPGLLSASIGVHPAYVHTLRDGWLPRLRARLEAAPLGIGEIGLDASLPPDPLETLRRDAFLAQFQLSRDLARPVSIHGRGAWDRILPLLLDAPPHPAGVLLHAYGGPPGLLPRLAEKNVYISIGPLLLRPGARKIVRIARAAIPGRLLVESDADGPPGASPSDLPRILAALATLRETAVPRLAEDLLRAARTLFAPLLPPSAFTPHAPASTLNERIAP